MGVVGQKRRERQIQGVRDRIWRFGTNVNVPKETKARVRRRDVKFMCTILTYTVRQRMEVNVNVKSQKREE
jgi:hypothetical protein